MVRENENNPNNNDSLMPILLGIIVMDQRADTEFLARQE